MVESSLKRLARSPTTVGARHGMLYPQCARRKNCFSRGKVFVAVELTCWRYDETRAEIPAGSPMSQR